MADGSVSSSCHNSRQYVGLKAGISCERSRQALRLLRCLAVSGFNSANISFSVFNDDPSSFKVQGVTAPGCALNSTGGSSESDLRHFDPLSVSLLHR